MFAIFRILEDHCLLPYLPKQSLKWLVHAEGNSGEHGSNKHRSTLLSVMDKCASQHGTAAAAWRLLRRLEQDDMFNLFRCVQFMSVCWVVKIKQHDNKQRKTFWHENFPIYGSNQSSTSPSMFQSLLCYLLIISSYQPYCVDSIMLPTLSIVIKESDCFLSSYLNKNM